MMPMAILGFIRSNLALGLFLIGVWFAHAQEPYYRKISFMEGLPSQVIYDLYVSREGRLYLGTERGLVTFDGVQFLVYDFVDNLGFAVNSIQEDEQGAIWCKNFANQIFKLEQGKLIQPEYVKKILERDGNNLIDFYLKDNSIYVLTEYILFELRPDKAPKIILQHKERRSKDTFTSMAVSSNGEVFEVSSLKKHYTLTDNKVVNEVQIENGQKESLVFQDQFYYLVKGGINEVYQLNGKLFSQSPFIKPPLFYKLAEASSTLWLCTSFGIYPIDTEKNIILPGLFLGSRINDIVEDNEGNLWVSSLDEGLFLIPDIKLKRLRVPEKIGNSKVTSLLKSEYGELFAGTSNGKIFSWSQQQKKERIFDTKTEMNIEFLYESEPFLVSSQGVFNRATGDLVIKGYYGKGMVQDDLGNHFMASYNSAGLLSKDFISSPILPEGFVNKTLEDFNNFNRNLFIIRNKRSRCVFFDSKFKTYYVGYSDGLYAYLPSGKIIEIRTLDNHPIITSEIQKGIDDGLWIATAQQGLIKIVDQKVVAQFQQNKGLTGSYCKRVKVTSNGVWVLTDTGINYLRNGNNVLENISYHLGFKGLTFNDILVDEEYVWIATNEGIITAPHTVFLNKAIPKFSIAGFYVNESEKSPKEALTYNQNQIDFTFNTQFYKGLGDFTYEFRLKEVDDNWKSQSSQLNTVTYRSLKPGKYTFQARVKYGNEYTTTEEFIFQISPPFWLSYWFFLIVILFMALLLYAMVRFIVKRIKRKQEMKEKLVLSQLTALRSQMNPHFLYNVLNAVQGLIYDNQKTKASEYLGAFSDLIRKTLDISDQSEITITKELETIELYVGLEEGRFEENTFFWSLELPRDEDLSQYVIPTLILQPFIENAIKHGLMHRKGEKLLHLKIDKMGAYWIFEVTDNGIGRKHSAEINAQISRHSSFATKALQNRIDLLNQVNDLPIKIEIVDLQQQGFSIGTKVVLQIPIKPLI